jgi:Tol biopolymer transport system component
VNDRPRRSRVEEVCDAALDRDARERAAFIASECGDDLALRHEVEALLAHARSAEGFLGAPLGAVAVQVLGDGVASLTGQQVGAYTILARLGAGGMGEVYRARDTKLGREVAIKVLPSAFVSDPNRLARFQREARLLATLNHPHIGAIYGVEEAGAIRALILELVEGPTLAERLNAGPLPVREAVSIARQIAEALDAAHDKGIIHRDLKPANIKVTPEGIVKVLDFGLAKAGALAGETADATRDGAILGTAGYMSPEQARGQIVDKRADIFAFGAILYEMLSGRRAFDGETAMDAVTAVLSNDPPELSAAERRIPPALTRIVDRCLKKNPAGRFQSASDLAFALEGVSSPSDTAAAAVPIGGGRTGLLQNPRTAWAVAASCAILVVLAIAALLYFRPAAPEPVVTRLDVVTPSTGDAYSLALSPDGRRLAFVANGDHGSQLWVRPLDQAMAQPLAGTEGAIVPFWAPDGSAVGFFAEGKLKRIDLTSGAVQALADVSNPQGGAWGADGTILFTPSSTDPLLGVPATGGAVTSVTHLAAGQAGHHWPEFLPDGRRFLFVVSTGQPEEYGIYVASLDGGEPTRIMKDASRAVYAPPGYLLLVARNDSPPPGASATGLLVAYPFDAASVSVTGEPARVAPLVGCGCDRGAFSVSAQGILAYREGVATRRRLVWTDRTGRVVGAVGSVDDTAPSFPDLSADDQRVAVVRAVQANVDVWLIRAGESVPRRFTFERAIDSGPIWSPDGSRIVFRTFRGGAYNLYEKPVDGTTDEQPLLVTPLAKAPQDWSRDGRLLLYSNQDPKTGTDLWALPMTGERKPFPVLQTQFDEIQGQFSPDGRWLAYASNESGRYEIYVQTFPETGGKWQISVGGGLQPRWRRDGQELFYIAPDHRLMAAPIHLAPGTRALEASAAVALFQTKLATGVNIVPAGFQARPQYAVAADGRFLMNVFADEGVTSPITIVQNWTVGLKK